MKPGKLYGVGIGPGDPQYLTLRAADVLRSVHVIFTVISKNASSSVSRAVVEHLRPRGEIRLQVFSMSSDQTVRKAQVRENAEAVIKELRAGRDAAKVSELLTRLESTARTDENLMPLFVECVENWITLGEITGVLRKTWGEYVPASWA